MGSHTGGGWPPEGSKTSSSKRKIIGNWVDRIFLGVPVLAVLWLIAALAFSAFVNDPKTSSPDTYHHYPLSGYLEAVEFDLTVEHPVMIGTNLEGTSGSINGSVGFFFGSGGGSVAGEFAPTSMVRILLPVEDGSSIIVFLPTEMIHFHTEGVEHATVRFGFKDDSNFGFTKDTWHYPEGRGFWTFGEKVRQVNDDIRDSWMWQNFQDKDIRDVIEEYVTRIDLYVTPVQMNQILGNT